MTRTSVQYPSDHYKNAQISGFTKGVVVLTGRLFTCPCRALSPSTRMWYYEGRCHEKQSARFHSRFKPWGYTHHRASFRRSDKNDRRSADRGRRVWRSSSGDRRGAPVSRGHTNTKKIRCARLSTRRDKKYVD